MAYGGHQLFRWSQPRAPGAQMRQLRDLFVDGAEGLAGNTVWKNTRVPLLDQNNVRDHRREDDAADLQPYH